MQSFLEIRRNFYLAAQNKPLDKDITPLSVDIMTFKRVFAPIRDIYLQYGACRDRDIGIHALIEELRQMCVEAHAIHTTQDTYLRDGRGRLLVSLQGLSESMKDYRGKVPYVVVDFDDMYNLSNLTDMLRDSALIYREYMHYPDIADAIDRVAGLIAIAKASPWSVDNFSEEMIEPQQDKVFA